jgi:DNA topoisomerase-1
MDHKIYLKDAGIYRSGNKYFFYRNKKEVTDFSELERLNSIKVPPAWTSVWYSSNKRCHIQVHGIDSSGKKQYILSEKWINSKRSEKYFRMKTFIRDLINFKKKIKIDNKFNNNNKDFVIKLLFNLLISIHIRVGNEIYAVKNKTYGLTTLLQKHLIPDGNNFTLSFVGKSNIKHSIKLPDEYNTIIKKFITKNKNDPLFYYYSENKIKSIDSEELNSFLKDNMGPNYTCKDFRTYSANILFIKAFLKNSKELNNGNFKTSINSIKKVILQSIDQSASLLGHTRTICKKSYISNILLDYCLSSFKDASNSSSSELLSKVWES